MVPIPGLNQGKPWNITHAKHAGLLLSGSAFNSHFGYMQSNPVYIYLEVSLIGLKHEEALITLNCSQ